MFRYEFDRKLTDKEEMGKYFKKEKMNSYSKLLVNCDICTASLSVAIYISNKKCRNKLLNYADVANKDLILSRTSITNQI